MKKKSRCEFYHFVIYFWIFLSIIPIASVETTFFT